MDYTILTPSTQGMRRVRSDNFSRWVVAHIRLMLAELMGRRPCTTFEFTHFRYEHIISDVAVEIHCQLDCRMLFLSYVDRMNQSRFGSLM